MALTLNLCCRFRNALLSLLGIDFATLFPRRSDTNGNGDTAADEGEETRMMSTTTTTTATTRVATVIREGREGFL